MNVLKTFYPNQFKHTMYENLLKQKPQVTCSRSDFWRPIKIAVILNTIALTQLSAYSNAQQISIINKRITLREFFDEITKQTGYHVVYQKETIDKRTPLALDIRNLQFLEVLDAVLAKNSLSYKIVGKDIVIRDNDLLKSRDGNGKLVSPQQTEIKGRVIDITGIPIAGASIKIKGSKFQVSSNQDGFFRLIDAPLSSTVLISYIGYQTLQVEARPDLGEIVLRKSEQTLDEVNVVFNTGYQQVSKERATGSFNQLDKNILERRPNANISSALQGLVSGMQGKENADGSVNFTIRGNTSMYADRNPLIVVDGFPVGNSDFSTINPNDVENITVLKDAAAASIWGARSANGVIVITTKKGILNSGLKIEANAFTRISDKPDYRQFVTTANSADHVAVEKMGMEKNWTSGGSNYAGGFPSNLSYPLTLAQEILYANKFGKISSEVMNLKLDSLSQIDNSTQMRDLLMRSSMLSQYNVSFTDGTKNSKSFASLLFEDNKTKYRGSDQKRYALNFSNQYSPFRFLTFDIGLFLQHRSKSNDGATLSEMQAMSPYETLLNPNGSYSENIQGQNREILRQLPLNLFPYADWGYNLLREVRGRDLRTKDYNARIQAGLNFKITKGLDFSTRFQYERGKIDVDNYYSEETYFVRNIANTFVEYNNTTRTVGKVVIPKGGIGQYNNTNLANYVFRNQLVYNKDLSERHAINAVAGMEISQYRTDTRINPWLYGYFPDKLQSSVPPYGYGSALSPVPHIAGVTTTLSTVLSATSGAGGNTVLGYNLDRFVSYYANAAYTFDSKYTVSGSIRSDASNFITKISSLRWEPLWSVGALWNIKKEKWIGEIGWLDRLTLRATYGRNGNVEKSSSTNTLLNVANTLNANTGTITATIADNGNPTLRWEKTSTTNIGSDFSLFGKKLEGRIEAYSKKGTDITGVVALAAATGTTSQRFNNAQISNKGIEIELGTQVPLPFENLTYSTKVNYAFNKNEVKSLYYPSILASNMLDPGNTYVEGKPINPVYSFDYLGMIDGIPQVAGPSGAPYAMNTLTLTSLPGNSFLKYMGTNTPPHTLGWYNAFDFKGFRFSALLIGTFGGVYRNPGFNYDSAYVGSRKTVLNKFVADVLAGRTDIPSFPQQNESNQYRWDRYANNLSVLVESSSFLECKEVGFDYTFPNVATKKIGISNLRLYTQIRDLGVVWSKNSHGYNPNWLPGTDRPIRSYTVGLNFSL